MMRRPIVKVMTAPAKQVRSDLRFSKDVTLSAEQRDVVVARGCPVQVIACAGAGKTEAVSRRIAALIAGGEAPASIVAFTGLMLRRLHEAAQSAGRPEAAQAG